MPASYVPIAVLFWTLAVFTLVILALTRLLGPYRPNPTKTVPYESGIRPLMPARRRFHVRFTLVAMLFMIFDVEAVSFYPWAVLLRRMGLFGLWEMALFVLVLGIGYAYVWHRGGFQWQA